jgi:hypothetical protein
MVTGSPKVVAVAKSGEEELTALTDSEQLPLLLIVIGRSANEETQTLPKSVDPERLIWGAPVVPVAESKRVGWVGSELLIWKLAA